MAHPIKWSLAIDLKYLTENLAEDIIDVIKTRACLYVYVRYAIATHEYFIVKPGLLFRQPVECCYGTFKENKLRK